MDDFLQTIRNNSKDKRYNKNRRNYDGNNGYNHASNENRRNGNEKRNKSYRGNAALDNISVVANETMVAVKDLLTELIVTQKRSIEVEERRAAAEERKADAMEAIAVYLKNMAGGEHPLSDENQVGIPFEKNHFAENQSTNVYADDENQEIALSKGENSAAESPASLNRDDVVQMIRSLREEGATYEFIAQQLTAKNIPTFSGRGEWHAQTIHRLCRKK